MIKTRQHYLGSFMAEPRSLNDCTALLYAGKLGKCTAGGQSRSGVLKGTISLASETR